MNRYGFSKEVVECPGMFVLLFNIIISYLSPWCWLFRVWVACFCFNPFVIYSFFCFLSIWRFYSPDIKP